MLRCAILDDYQDAAQSRGDFGKLAGTVEFSIIRENIAETPALLDRLAPFEIIVAMRERTRFDAERLAGLPNLKLLITTGMRNASIDMEAAARHGITVCGTEGFAGSAAELTWGLLLALMRHIPREAENFRAGGPWQLTVGRDLRGLRLGVIGLGTLGKLVAGYGCAFGMDVAGWSRSNTPERSAELGIGHVPTLDALLGRSDVVSIHIPLNPTTRGLIGARELGLLPPGAILLNTSRGPIVDEAAMIAALRSGQLGGAGLDVFDPEPLPKDHVLRQLDNVMAVPHLGYVTENAYALYFTGAVAAIAAWLAGAPIRVLSSPPRG